MNQCNVFHAIRIAKVLFFVFVCVAVLIVLLSRKAIIERPLFILSRTLIIDELCIAKLLAATNGTELRNHHNSHCQFPLKVALFNTTSSSSSSSSPHNNNNPLLQIDYFVVDVPSKDFWLFAGKNVTIPTRALKRFPTFPVRYSLGDVNYEFEIPSNLALFRQRWHNGRYHECQILLKRNETELKRFLPLTMVDRAAGLTAHMELFNVTGFLFGGTLLGWRRECSLIPHTGDLDIGIFAHEHSPPLLDSLIHSDKFLLKWILGHPRDSMEITLWMDNFKTDLFYLYYNASRAQSYMSGMRAEKRQRIRWFYPPILELCAGEMRGHIFHVPCNFEQIIEAEYGKEEWRTDFPTSQFFWDKSHKNKESGEIIDETEWKRIYNVYYPKEEHNQTLPKWD